jgi:hypothetical protein
MARERVVTYALRVEPENKLNEAIVYLQSFAAKNNSGCVITTTTGHEQHPCGLKYRVVRCVVMKDVEQW